MVEFSYLMTETAPCVRPHLIEPIEAYIDSRHLPREILDQHLAELQSIASDSAFAGGDFTLNFAMSMIHLRTLEADVPPAMLLFEIVDIAQFSLAYFQDERALSEVVSAIRGCLEE